MTNTDWKRTACAWGPALVYAAIIFLLSAQSHLPKVPVIGKYDKIQHMIEYFGFGLTLIRATLILPIRVKISPFVQALLLGSLFGASDEFHQHFVPCRTMDIHDWLADTTAVLIAISVVFLYHRLKSQE